MILDSFRNICRHALCHAASKLYFHVETTHRTAYTAIVRTNCHSRHNNESCEHDIRFMEFVQIMQRLDGVMQISSRRVRQHNLQWRGAK